jgi:phosphate transport system permease protein
MQLASELAMVNEETRAVSTTIPAFWTGRHQGDRVYRVVLQIAAAFVLVIIIGLVYELVSGSSETLATFGLGFFTSSTWNPSGDQFGALPFILGTLYTSLWALALALPISLFTAIFLSEIAPWWIAKPVSFMVELLAAIPSVVYGLWGIFVLQPWLVKHIETPISHNPALSRLPIFSDTANGYDMLAASMILAIMILPYITSVSRDILQVIPRSMREGSYALGATKWQTIKKVVLPYARAGIIGGVVLGFGRALGETMAVTMVIGNAPVFKTSLFSSGYTLSSVIANELAEASGLHRSALIELGLTLFIVTLLVNAGARLLIAKTAQNIHGGSK